MKAPVIGGVRIPTGNGQTVRLRQGASLADLAEKINVNPAALVTVLFHLGEMATATQSLDESTFQILGEGDRLEHPDRLRRGGGQGAAAAVRHRP